MPLAETNVQIEKLCNFLSGMTYMAFRVMKLNKDLFGCWKIVLA